MASDGDGRVDSKKWSQAVTASSADFDAVETRLAKLIERMTPDARKRCVKGRPEVIAAAAGLADRSSKHPTIVAASNFDAEAVKEDCVNLKALEALEAKLESLQSLIADARLAWEAEVMVPVLDFYAAAKRPSKDDAELALTIKPLKDVLSSPREAKK